MVSQVVSAAVLCLLAVVVHAGEGQPPQSDSIGQFKIVGDSIVSAQQVSQIALSSACLFIYALYQ
jgi:hypothetical protein